MDIETLALAKGYTNKQIKKLSVNGIKGDKGDPGKDAVIDTTLSNSGEAADAKVVGNEISSLKEDLDGVNNDVFVLNTELMTDSEPREITIEQPVVSITTDETHCVKSNGVGKPIGILESTDRYFKKFPVSENVRYKIAGLYYNNEWTALCVFVDSNNNVISDVYDTEINSWTKEPMYVTAPVGAVFAYVNGSNENSTVIKNVIPNIDEVKIVRYDKEFKYKDILDKISSQQNEKESYLDKKIKHLESKATVIADFSNAKSVSGNANYVAESLYGKKDIIINSLRDNNYEFDVEINFKLEAERKYYLVFKTDRQELSISKGLKIIFFNSDNQIIYNFDTNYGFSYPKVNGWNLHEFSVPNNLTISKMYVRLTNVSSDYIPRIKWDSIITDRKIKPFVFYCSESSLENVCTKTVPILHQHNMKGCVAVDLTDATDEQITYLYNSGIDFGVYGVKGFNGTLKGSDWGNFVSDETNKNTIELEIKKDVDSFVSKNKFPHAYFCKYNLSTPTILQAVKENNISLIRTSADNGIFSLYSPDDMEIPCIGLNDSNLQIVNELIDKAVSDGVGICVFTHQVVDGGDTTGLNVGTDTFTSFCEHCKSYIDNGALQSFNAEDVINFFTGDSQICDVNEIKYKIKQLG